MGDGLLAEVCDEGPSMRLESSEAEDVTSGEVQRERGPTPWMWRASCGGWREGDDEGEFEAGVEGASTGR